MLTQKRPLKVFLSYASQDRPAVQGIYDALKLEKWIDPWLDKAKILPGQDWQMVIETAVDEADVAILCLSNQSVTKEGYVQREIKYAYDIALEKPDGTIFLIPLRLDECEIPRKLRFLHRVDYFGPEKNSAHSDLLDALKVRHEQKLTIGAEDRDRRDKRRVEGTATETAAIKETKSEAVENVTPKKLEPGPAGNTGKQETSPTEKARRNRRRRRKDTTLTAAIIGAVVTIIAALIPLFANRMSLFQTPTPTSTVAITSTVTDTPIPSATITTTPTFTPVRQTDTPVPTITVIPPIPLGQDWIAGCISTLWRPYPADIPVTERGDGCWHEPVYVFVAENGDLDFLAERKTETNEIYGMFAPLPEKGTVNFTVRLRDLRNVDLWMGVFAEPNITSESLLMIIPHGDVKKRVVVQKDALTYENIAGTSLLEQENGFSISFTFTANSARGTVNPSVFRTNSVSITSSQKWLFLGYRGLAKSYRIDGTFLSFELK